MPRLIQVPGETEAVVFDDGFDEPRDHPRSRIKKWFLEHGRYDEASGKFDPSQAMDCYMELFFDPTFYLDLILDEVSDLEEELWAG